MSHGAGQDPASHGSCSRTVMSLVQQGPASPYFQILSLLPLVLSVVLDKYLCRSIALLGGGGGMRTRGNVLPHWEAAVSSFQGGMSQQSGTS